MNGNRLHFSDEQCRIMLCMAIAVLALFFFRYDLPSGSTCGPAAAGGVEIRPPFVIEIAGEVVRPGVYTFSHEVDCAEVIRRSGGLKGSAGVPADMLSAVPVNGSLFSIGSDPAFTALKPMDPQKRFLYFVPFGINRASAEELVLVPGIGETIARAIVSHRERHGCFARLESLLAVPGIGRRNFEQMKAFLAL